MSGAEDKPLDEFGEIARLFRPLTRGASEAFDLLDDAAAVPSRDGQDLVITKDALVAGVHFQPDDPPGIVARKLMRANLSDLAAKGAEPYAYLLMAAWPDSYGLAAREAFAAGLAADGEAFDVFLLGGDTVRTTGPLTVSMTLLGWAPAGMMVRRAGAKPGDLVMVSGPIGDGWLDWGFATGAIGRRYLDQDHRLPVPRLDLRETLRGHASAAADVSDGLIADASHIAKASGVGLEIDLDAMPVSEAGARWLGEQPDRGEALLRLAVSGEDYEIVCTAPPAAARALGLPVIGKVTEDQRVCVNAAGKAVEAGAGGWRHS
jgi:thiamine-monophosphate kinase